jgi:cation:H+ antiporter
MTLPIAVLVFLVTAAIVVAAGTRLATYGDEIAERTGLGGLFVGTLVLAFATSLPELVTDITAAATGAPDLALGDLFGSSMANMAILAFIDLRHRGRVWPAVELGHARVAAVAIVLTSLAAVGIHTSPEPAIGWVGVTSVLILVFYVIAVAWFRRSPALPRTAFQDDTPALLQPTGIDGSEDGLSLRSVAIRFAVAALFILGAAPLMTLSGARIAELTGVAQTAIGVLLLAVTTSLPELTTSLAAVKIGAYDLAVGNLFGSNAANMSIVFFADLAYRDGPILSAVSPAQSVAALGAILLTALAVAAIVGGTETRIRRLEPDATVLLLVYLAAALAVFLAA